MFRVGKVIAYILASLMILGVCVAAGAAFVFSMMGGDFCVAPATYTSDMADMSSSGSDYYLSCSAAGDYPLFYPGVRDLTNKLGNMGEAWMATKSQVTDALYTRDTLAM